MVLGAFTDTVEKFTNEGRLISRLDLSRNTRDPTGFPVNAFRIAIDGDDNLYVGYFDGAVHKVDSNGTLLARISSPGSGDGQVFFPTGIAFGSDSTVVYIADGGNTSVDVFALDTTTIPEFSGLVVALVLAVSIVAATIAASQMPKLGGWSGRHKMT